MSILSQGIIPTNSYSGAGYTVQGRTANYHGLAQEFSCMDLKKYDNRELYAKLFVKYIGAHETFNVKTHIHVNFLDETISSETYYMQFIKLHIPAENGENEWFEIGGMVLMDMISIFNPTDDQLANSMTCKFVFVTQESTIS